MSGTSIDELESQVAQLSKRKIYNSDVEEQAKRILSELPSLESQQSADEKVRLLLLRCKTRLLRPTVSKEAEEDINTILKLNKGTTETWVELSECLFRRNACKEATDALDNALRLDPGHVPALCQYSQVLRNRCASEKLSTEEKRGMLADAVEKAKKAVSIDANSGDAWNALGLSLLSKATLEGADRDELRRASAAMEQALQKSPEDPDVHFNMGMLESLRGRFAPAAAEIAKAYEMDRLHLKGAVSAFEENVSILRRANSSMANARGIGKREFKKWTKSLAAFIRKNGDGAGTVSNFCVLNILSEPLMQPVTLLAIDPNNKFCLLLFHQVKSGAFKIGDVISTLKSSIITEEDVQRIEAYPSLDLAEPVELALPRLFGDSASLMVNGHRIPDAFRASLQVSARLFA